jgi:hypothetical protein
LRLKTLEVLLQGNSHRVACCGLNPRPRETQEPMTSLPNSGTLSTLCSTGRASLSSLVSTQIGHRRTTYSKTNRMELLNSPPQC